MIKQLNLAGHVLFYYFYLADSISMTTFEFIVMTRFTLKVLEWLVGNPQVS